MGQFEGNTVKLRMTKMILDRGRYDEAVHACKVIMYKKEEERIYLLTGKTELTEFSLDANYECTIPESGREIRCGGFIRERYWNKLGKVIVFQIKNGFYKNTVN